MSKRILLLLIVMALSTSLQGMEVTYFDVGQGNCSHIASLDTSVPQMLVDCGSSEFMFKDKNFKKNQINSIAKKITMHATKVNADNCILVVSHPDNDHYGWIPHLFKECTQKRRTFYFYAIYLGGTRQYYSKEFRDFLEKREKNPLMPAIIEEPTKNQDLEIILSIFAKPANMLSFSILPALQCTGRESTNECSLVVRIEFEHTVFLLTGDATIETTKHIMSCCSKNGDNLKLKAQVLQASHHGAAATDEKCNDLDWVTFINPTYVIISSGLMHRHPREDAVNVFLKTVPDCPAGTHQIVYYGIHDDPEKQHIVPFARFMKRYGVLSTKKGIFGTLKYGTIKATLKAGSAVELHPDISDAAKNEKESLVKAMLAAVIDAFTLDNMTNLNLKGLGLNDKDVDDRKLFFELLDALNGVTQLHLASLLLAGNTVSQDDTVRKIVELIKNRSVEKFSIHESDLQPSMKQQIIDQWANRGLEFTH